MDMQQSNLIAAAAYRRQSEIPDAERCPSCDGMGQADLGCAITHTIWATCSTCGGSGHLADVPEFLRARIPKAAPQERDGAGARGGRPRLSR